MRVRLTFLIAAAAALFVGLNQFALSSPAPRTSHGLRLLGAIPASDRVTFALELRARHPSRLQTRLAAVEDPRSPAFRHFISPEAYGDTFGLPAPELNRIQGAVRSAGLHVAQAGPQRTELEVNGRAAAVDRLLHTRLASYVDAQGHRYHAPLSPVRVPTALRGAVAAVTGLDTRPTWHAHDVPLGGLTPTLMASAYDIGALHRLGFNGQGETIAVISFAAFNPRDPAEFARHYGLTGPAPQVIPVQGGTSDLLDQNEANLDVDIIRAIAPAARILVYETYSNYAAAIHQIVSNRAVDVASSSWGDCEPFVNSGQRTADSQELRSAGLAGLSVFIATGDNGAYDCQKDSPSNHRLTVDWPAASANAIAVGGTRLYITSAGSYRRETAWEDQLSIQGGGGGFAMGDRLPSWQSGPGVRSRFSDGHRQVPDVSANADLGTPWSYFSRGTLRADGAGTSASTPFWAAAWALIDQYAKAHGVGRPGFADSVLYALASSHQRYPAFHDVTVGANRYYQAGPGWDPATGLGSPDVYNLARDIVSYLRSNRRKT